MIKEAFLICALALPVATIKGPKQEAAFFRLFHALAKEGEVMLTVKEVDHPDWERLGGVVFRGNYFHVYRRVARTQRLNQAA